MSVKLIHVGKITPNGGGVKYLYLRQKDPKKFTWYEEEVETPISAPTVEEAIRQAHLHWKRNSFRTLICGFQYTLPERDEHGVNAYFHQMVASYSTVNGVYVDEDRGHMCRVDNASQEALRLWKQLEKENRL